MKLAVGMFAFAALFSPAISAQVPTATGSTTDERRLTPEQVDAILAEAEKKRTAAQHAPPEIAAIEDSELQPPPQVHGEVGFSIGTGGYREVFGTGIYPLGQDGMAIISLDFVDWGHRRWPK